MNALISFAWWSYFFSSYLVILKRSVFNRRGCQLTFRSASRLGTFVFSLTINLLIYAPLFFLVGIYINIGVLKPGLLVVVVFGILFGVFIRNLIGESMSFISYDGQDWIYESFGFHRPTEKRITPSQISGVMLFEFQNIDRYNYKVA